MKFVAVSSLTIRCVSLVFFAAALPPLAAHAEQDLLPTFAAGILAKSGVPASRVGLYVADPSGNVLAAHNMDANYNPASTIKLAVAMAALDMLGPDFSWQTDLLSDAVIKDGTLEGDLYLRGSGDPTITNERLLGLVAGLRSRGIRAIRGDIVVDASLFEQQEHDSSSFDGAGTRPYNGSGGAAMIGFGSSKIVIVNDGGKIRAFAEPPSSTFKVVNKMQSRRARCHGNWRGKVRELLTREPDGSSSLVLKGSYPTGCRTQSFYLLAQNDPVAHIAGAVIGYFRSLGGTADGGWRRGTMPKKATVLATTESPTLAEALQRMNKHSNNVMARNIFLMLASVAGNAPYTKEAAREVLSGWFEKIGVTAQGLFVDNGSGLSRDVRITPRQFAGALSYFAAHPYFAELASTLPILGVDGTTRKWLRRSAAAGDAHIKTGTLAGVRSAVGYVHSPSGGQLLFVAMIDWRDTYASRRVLQGLLSWVHSSLVS